MLVKCFHIADWVMLKQGLLAKGNRAMKIMLTSRKSRLLTSVCQLLILVFVAGFSLAREKKVLTLEDYPLWKQVVSTAISSDGNWITYGYRPNDGDDTLYVKSTTSERLHEIPGGTNPVFSKNSQWVAYFVNLPKNPKQCIGLP